MTKGKIPSKKSYYKREKFDSILEREWIEAFDRCGIPNRKADFLPTPREGWERGDPGYQADREVIIPIDGRDTRTLVEIRAVDGYNDLPYELEDRDSKILQALDCNQFTGAIAIVGKRHHTTPKPGLVVLGALFPVFQGVIGELRDWEASAAVANMRHEIQQRDKLEGDRIRLGRLQPPVVMAKQMELMPTHRAMRLPLPRPTPLPRPELEQAVIESEMMTLADATLREAHYLKAFNTALEWSEISPARYSGEAMAALEGARRNLEIATHDREHAGSVFRRSKKVVAAGLSVYSDMHLR